MRIVSLASALTEVLHSVGRDEALVGISHQCEAPPARQTLPRLTAPLTDESGAFTPVDELELAVDVAALKALTPDIVLCAPYNLEDQTLTALRTLFERAGVEAKLSFHSPRTLEQVYQDMEAIGRLCGAAADGTALVQRIRAQFLDWGDSFYERMKNKRLTLLSGHDPLVLAGRWIPDLIGLTSCISQAPCDGKDDQPVQWPEIVRFRPDVIVVAPRGADLRTTLATFKQLEKLPGWDAVPAVKRGEVIFCSGHDYFYRPSSRLIASMSVLVSAAAGFDSGYITPRESFFRLRWLELQRHRF